MSGRRHALRGPTEPHLRLPRHRGEREQRQVPAPLLHPGHSAGKPGVVHGQPTGEDTPASALPGVYFNLSFPGATHTVPGGGGGLTVHGGPWFIAGVPSNAR